MNVKKFSRFFIALLSGLVLGSALTLLFTPQSGEEFRTQISEKTVASRQKFQANYEQTRQRIEEQVGKLQQGKQVESEQEAQ